ncbi:MAG: hypothetical protein HY515_01725 [Candidatus Aenigmarchaeota archaeon]|nr:hypothetical protein [Candidatus Aenigmarchaeota archaeon]
MSSWPPAVLLGTPQDVMRQIFRGMLRACGVRNAELRSSCEDVLAVLQDKSRRWDILILDGSFQEIPKALRAIKEEAGTQLRVVLVFSALTREEILAAKDAGADDFMVYPVSQAVLESRLRKLMEPAMTAR